MVYIVSVVFIWYKFHEFEFKHPNIFLGPLWWLFLHYEINFFSFLTVYTVYTIQEAGFTGFMRSLRGRDQEKVGKRKEEL